jgi:chaperonin cofactor prefoldin
MAWMKMDEILIVLDRLMMHTSEEYSEIIEDLEIDIQALERELESKRKRLETLKKLIGEQE